MLLLVLNTDGVDEMPDRHIAQLLEAVPHEAFCVENNLAIRVLTNLYIPP